MIDPIPQKQPDQNWTAAQSETVRVLYLADKSLSEIGNAVGKSRSSVAGKIRRLDLPKRRMRNNAPTGVKPVRQRKPKHKPVPPQPIPPVEPSLHPVPFLKAKWHHCRAVLDRRDAKGGVLFCGDPKQNYSAFCAHHHARFHRSAANKED